MLCVKAIRFEQNGRVFYITAIPAGELIKVAQVDVWSSDNPNMGYQRAPSQARKREIARYAMGKDAIMPLGGLVNARPQEGSTDASYGRNLRFEAEGANGAIAFGTLTIRDGDSPLYVVDMQHRLGGYEHAILEEGAEQLRDFPLVVTIADGLSKLEEVDQFYLINTTQKRVRTDLARRLKAYQARDIEHRLTLDQQGKLWEARGPIIADILNHSEGVWHGRVLPPNKSKADQPTMVIRETSFVTSLRPILQTPYFVRLTVENSARLLGMYWSAIARAFPAAIHSPEDCVLQKTPGVFALHELAPEIFEMARDKGDIPEVALYEIMRGLATNLDANYWLADNPEGAARYGSMKGFRILASYLRQRLPDVQMA
jgi:DGQHR domain-containing protein